MARDRVAEIAAIRARKGKYGAKYRAEETVRSCHNRVFGEAQLTDYDYFPIKLVTALEVFTRECVAQLVDSGEPYINRARRVIKELRFDFDLTRALVGKSVSFGELVSHVVSLNSISDIDRAMSELTENSLDDLLSLVNDRWSVEVLGEPPVPIIDDVQSLKASLQRLFETRHVMVHEMPETRPFGYLDLQDFCNAALQYTRAMGEVVETLIYGKPPLTQNEMNQDARDSAAAMDANLAATLLKFDAREESKRFQAAQQRWETFREGEATFLSRMDTDRFEQGSIAPLIFWVSWEALTKDRIDWLNNHHDDRYSFQDEHVLDADPTQQVE